MYLATILFKNICYKTSVGPAMCGYWNLMTQIQFWLSFVQVGRAGVTLSPPIASLATSVCPGPRGPPCPGPLLQAGQRGGQGGARHHAHPGETPELPGEGPYL